MPSSVLLVAATRAEAADLPADLPLVVTGIGKTPAAVAVTRALLTYADPASVHVVNLGTAGALRPGVTGLHVPSAVVNHDLNADAIRTLGYDPGERIELEAVDADGPVLASGDVFVTDPAVRDRLAAEAHLVDMEGYAVAYAARALGARVTLVKHVSDGADDTAWDWPTQVAASARALGRWCAEHRDGWG